MVIVMYVLGLLLAIGIYLAVVFTQVPGAFEERFGGWLGRATLPPDLDRWVVDATSPEALAALRENLRREVRLWVEEPSGFLGRRRVVRQVRYVNQAGNVVRAEPDQAVRASELRRANR